MSTALDDARAAWLLAAARGPRRACHALPSLDDRPATLALAALRAPTVCVPAESARDAIAPLARALDALCARAEGPATLPIATLWLSYDAARFAADPRPVDDPRPLGDRCPAALLAEHDAVTLRDATTWSLVARRGEADAEERAVRSVTDEGRKKISASFASLTSRASFLRQVAATRASIAAGDVYLVNLARRMRAPSTEDDAAFIAQRVALARASRSLVASVDGVIVGGMSMELALRWARREGVAWSAPIKGTRPRRPRASDDRAEAAALIADPKERAENAMAVDVHRNDLSRVASRVTAPACFVAEAHAFVHHLTSWVRAEVPVTLGAEEMLRALLPVGSVTGAPKLAAMDHIAAMEPTRRGLYTGVYGAVFGDGSVELAVAIRTLVADPSGLSYGVGGGVVWDSDPAREWRELGWKSRAIR